MKVFVVALDCEAETVVRNMTDSVEQTLFGRRAVRGRIGGEETVVVVAGVGKANAAAGAQIALSPLAADAILNVGVAAGLEPSMEIGDMFRVTRAVQCDIDLSGINGTPVGTPNEYTSPFFGLCAAGRWPDAVVATGDRFSDDESEADHLRRTFAATVRDMELGAIAHVAKRSGVPLYAWKAISDVAGRGSASGQYSANLARCIDRLAAAIPDIFGAA